MEEISASGGDLGDKIKSTFLNRCRVIVDQGDYAYIIRLNLEPKSDLTLQVSIPKSGERPDVFLIGGKGLGADFHAEFLTELNHGHDNSAQSPNALLLLTNADALWRRYTDADPSLIERVVPSENTHKKAPRKPKGKRPAAESDPEKRRIEGGEQQAERMKTSLDVINRIRWDETIDSANVVVGYTDRFVGVVEKPFDEFDWSTRFADAAPEDVASIPQHRIRYFRYKSAKIWDRDARLDAVFESTNGGRTRPSLAAIMRRENGRVGGKVEDVPVDDGVDAEFSTLTLNDLHASCSASVDVDDVDSNAFPNGARPDYFLAVQLARPEVPYGVELVQQTFERQFGSLPKRYASLDTLHLTTFLFNSALVADGLSRLEMTLLRHEDTISDLLRCVHLELSGLSLLKGRVLCSEPVAESYARLTSGLKSIFAQEKLDGCWRENQTPHMTIARLKQIRDVDVETAVTEYCEVSRFNASLPNVVLSLRPVGHSFTGGPILTFSP